MRTTSEKKPVNQKGFAFSFDAAIAFFVLTGILFLIAAWISGENLQIVKEQKKLELWKNTLFAADSLVKNSSSGQSTLGSVIFDAEKRRAKSNEIDLKLLEKTHGFENPEFELKKIKIVFENENSEKIFFEKNSEKKNCIAIERIVFAEGKIAKLVLEGCT